MSKNGLWEYLIVGFIMGLIIGAVITGDMQCLTPFIAVFIILGLLVFVGLLIDPKATMSMLGSIKSDWKDIFNGE